MGEMGLDDGQGRGQRHVMGDERVDHRTDRRAVNVGLGQG